MHGVVGRKAVTLEPYPADPLRLLGRERVIAVRTPSVARLNPSADILPLPAAARGPRRCGISA
jgi:hypothetical protein